MSYRVKTKDSGNDPALKDNHNIEILKVNVAQFENHIMIMW